MPVYTRLFDAFLITVIVLYYSLKLVRVSPARRVFLSKLLLLVFNTAFYLYAGVRFLPFLVYIACLSYISGIVLSRRPGKALFTLCTVLMLSPLIILKAMGWLNFRGAFLPLGISFFTLQAFTYICSIYRGEMEPYDLLSVLLFVSFFPSVTSGPILRAAEVIPQFQEYHEFDYDDFTDGLKLLAWGLFKKLVLADNMATYIMSVNRDVFELGNVSGTALFLTCILYSFQLYLDFSGYSDIVTGSARTLGFNIRKNFDHPYISKTISEFWRRWHMSLSSWFRDYIYFPLGGSRVKEIYVYRNLILVFIISGLWHGNGATFLVWGCLHGIFSCLDRLLRKAFDFKGSVILTFISVTFAWIFFAADSVKNALFTIRSFAQVPAELVALLSGEALLHDILLIPEGFNLVLLLAGLFLYLIISFGTRHKDGLVTVRGLSPVFRWALYFALILCVLLFASSEPVNFIYNRF